MCTMESTSRLTIRRSVRLRALCGFALFASALGAPGCGPEPLSAADAADTGAADAPARGPVDAAAPPDADRALDAPVTAPDDGGPPRDGASHDDVAGDAADARGSVSVTGGGSAPFAYSAVALECAPQPGATWVRCQWSGPFADPRVTLDLDVTRPYASLPAGTALQLGSDFTLRSLQIVSPSGGGPVLVGEGVSGALALTLGPRVVGTAATLDGSLVSLPGFASAEVRVAFSAVPTTLP
jgi:hypothetical protein